MPGTGTAARRSASPSPPGCRCCCGARRARARRRPSGPWPTAWAGRARSVIAAIREPSDFAGLPVVVDGRGPLRPAPVGPAAGRRRARAAVPRRDLHRPAGRAGRPAAGRARAGRRRPRPARRRGRGRRRQPARAGGRRLGPVRPAGQPLLPPRLDGRARRPFAQGLAGGFEPPAVPGAARRLGRRHPRTPGAWSSAFITVRPGLVCDAAHRRGPRPAGAGPAPAPGRWPPGCGPRPAPRAPAPRPRPPWSPARSARGRASSSSLWHMEMDLPDPEDVLADPDGFALPERGDRAYAVLSSVAAAVAAKPTPERWLAGWKVVGKAGEEAPDVAAVAARVLAQCRPPGAAAPPEVKLFLPLLKDAGLAATAEHAATTGRPRASSTPTSWLAARLWAVRRYPYLAAALFASPVIASPGLGRVDGRRRRGGCTSTPRSSTTDQRRDPRRPAGPPRRPPAARPRRPGQAPGRRRADEPTDWALAADAEINDDLIGTGLRLPDDRGRAPRPRAGSRAGWPRSTSTRPTSDTRASRDCGSGADGRVRDVGAARRAGRRQRPAHRASGDLLRSQVAGDVLDYTPGRRGPAARPGGGGGPRTCSTPKVDWRRVAGRRDAPGPVHRDAGGSTTPTAGRRAGRRPVARRRAARAAQRPVPEVAVVCDTSGSMGDDELAIVLAEVDGLLAGVGLARNRVRVLAVDAAVHDRPAGRQRPPGRPGRRRRHRHGRRARRRGPPAPAARRWSSCSPTGSRRGRRPALPG